MLFDESGFVIGDVAETTGLAPERVEAIAVGRWLPSPAERTKNTAAFGVSIDEVSWGHKTPIRHIYGHGPG